jgi:hypothetical protein
VRAMRRRAKKPKRKSYSENTLLKFLKGHLSKEYPNPRREGCPPKLTPERLAKQPPASRSFRCLPRFSLLPLLQGVSPFACSCKSKDKGKQVVGHQFELIEATFRITGPLAPNNFRLARHSGTIRPYDDRAMMSDGFSMVRECRRGRPIGQYRPARKR